MTLDGTTIFISGASRGIDMSLYAYVEGAEPQVDVFVDHL